MLPELKQVKRDREFSLYEEALRDRLLYTYLFRGDSYRKMDREVLCLNQKESDGWQADTKGWQSRGVLGYMGITGKHKGIFKDMSIHVVIEQLERENGWQQISEALQRYAWAEGCAGRR